MIKIDFEISKNEHTLKDALILPDDHKLSKTDIEAIQQKRFDDWYAIMTAPQEEVEVIKE